MPVSVMKRMLCLVDVHEFEYYNNHKDKETFGWPRRKCNRCGQVEGGLFEMESGDIHWELLYKGSIFK